MSTGIDPSEIWNLENLVYFSFTPHILSLYFTPETEAPRPKLTHLILGPNDRRVFAWSVRVHGLERCQSLTPGRIVWVHTPRYYTHASRYYIYIYSGLYKYMYMYMYMCMSMSMCMYMCISICVCMYCYIDTLSEASFFQCCSRVVTPAQDKSLKATSK